MRAAKLRRDASIGRREAALRGAGWADYAQVVQIAKEMEEEADELAADVANGRSSSTASERK